MKVSMAYRQNPNISSSDLKQTRGGEKKEISDNFIQFEALHVKITQINK